MLVTLLPMATETRLLQPLKVLLSMDVTLVGRVTDVSEEQWEKA